MISVPDTLLPDAEGIGGVVSLSNLPGGSLYITAYAHIRGEPLVPVWARSDDRGSTWEVGDHSLPMQGRFHFLTPETGWFAGTEFVTRGDTNAALDVIAVTTDGGTTWTRRLDSAVHPAYGIVEIRFANERVGMAGGAIGKLYVTVDGGERWHNISVSTDTIAGVWGIAMPTPSIAFVSGGLPTVVKFEILTSDVEFAGNIPDVDFLRIGDRLIIVGNVAFDCSDLTATIVRTDGRATRVPVDCNGSSASVNLHQLPAGAYLVRIESVREYWTTKLLLHR